MILKLYLKYIDFLEVQQLWNGDRFELIAKPGEDGQMRYGVLGKIKGIHHTVIITYRGSTVRIISARLSTENEKAIYESQIKKI